MLIARSKKMPKLIYDGTHHNLMGTHIYCKTVHASHDYFEKCVILKHLFPFLK